MSRKIKSLLEIRFRFPTVLITSLNSLTGNPCGAEKPFPCKTGNICIPMAYVCDDNIDCFEDGYDEEPEVCTAGENEASAMFGGDQHPA
jgi:hypothetical protein